MKSSEITNLVALARQNNVQANGRIKLATFLSKLLLVFFHLIIRIHLSSHLVMIFKMCDVRILQKINDFYLILLFPPGLGLILW